MEIMIEVKAKDAAEAVAFGKTIQGFQLDPSREAVPMAGGTFILFGKQTGDIDTPGVMVWANPRINSLTRYY